MFNFASKSAILQRRLVYDLLELPPDLLFRYRDGVQNVTPEDVLGAAQRHLHPNEQVCGRVYCCCGGVGETVDDDDGKGCVSDLLPLALSIQS